MTNTVCTSPLHQDTLLAYWLGELDPDREAAIEEHYLGCAACSRRLAWLIDLAQQVRALTQQSNINMILTEEFVRRIRADGLQVREYHVPHNGSVNCTVSPDDDLVVGYLAAPLTDVTRVDMLTLDGKGALQSRQEDIPFNHDNGSVVFATPIDVLRDLPTGTTRVRLLAVDNQGEHILGEYTFNHTAMRT